METLFDSPSQLKSAWDALKQDEPKLRIRDAAQKLGVSEAELLATGLGENVIRLKSDFVDQVLKFPKLGKVMSLTRNDGCVLEHKGPFQKIEIMQAGPQQIATVIGPIEQRLFFGGWKFGFAVSNETPHGPQNSLQYFDQEGNAVLKVFFQDQTDLEFAEQLVREHTAEEQNEALVLVAFPAKEYTSRADLDFDSFSADWENMKDTHDFFGMLRRYKLNRLNAVEWIGEKWAYEVDKASTKMILDAASETQLPIMIFAGNMGNIQIHQGKIKNVVVMGPWLNVMDPDFNMHLDESKVDRVFVVHKHTTEGMVSALELFDKAGEMVAQFFGLRKPGIPQKPEWKAILDNLN